MTSRTPDRPRCFKVGRNAAPEHLVLAVADVEAEDLPAAVGGDPGGDDDRHRGDLAEVGVADVQVGGVEVTRTGTRCGPAVGCGTRSTCSSRPAQIRDTSDLEMPESMPERGDQVVDRPGRDPVHVGLHHHRVQGLVDPPPRLEDRPGRTTPCAASGSAAPHPRPGWPTAAAGRRCVR